MVKTATPQSRPITRAKLGNWWLTLLAAASLVAWLGIELRARSLTHPAYPEMLNAARAIQAASTVLLSKKRERGIWPGLIADPNRTGMIGPEYTAITTSLGILEAKRTTTNPDFAAALVRFFSERGIGRGDTVVLILSGSFVGGNIATTAALEALGTRTISVSSLGASMWGATDPDFNWLEIEAALRDAGIIEMKSMAAVIGGTGGVGRELEKDAVASFYASAKRHKIPLVREEPLPSLVTSLADQIEHASGGAHEIDLVVNVGGAVVGLGSCRESYEIASGLQPRPSRCSEGTPGLVYLVGTEDVSLFNILNIRHLAAEFGLPYDPTPLPMPGDNPLVYGGL